MVCSNHVAFAHTNHSVFLTCSLSAFFCCFLISNGLGSLTCLLRLIRDTTLLSAKVNDSSSFNCCMILSDWCLVILYSHHMSALSSSRTTLVESCNKPPDISTLSRTSMSGHGPWHAQFQKPSVSPDLCIRNCKGARLVQAFRGYKCERNSGSVIRVGLVEDLVG